MHRVLVIPALLFGLLFSCGGYFILSETALPMWHNWQRMQDWRPASARLLSMQTADNDTRASYRYDFAGGSYQGNGVGVSKVRDNIGYYQRDMQAYLREIELSGDILPIWVNPMNPSEAVIDRDMRWGLFALSVGFCSLFIVIGLGIVYASFRGYENGLRQAGPSMRASRKSWQRLRDSGGTQLGFLEFRQRQYAESASVEPAEVTPGAWQRRKGWESAEIKSDAVGNSRLFWIFAGIWNAVSSPIFFILPDELQRGNYLALLALLFPAIGLLLFYKAVARTLEYRRFGKTLLSMDPYPGAIGGHVGGQIQVNNLDYRTASEAKVLRVRLECVYSYISGSGEDRSRRESIEWAEQGRPKIDSANRGVRLGFRFDVPADLPQSDIEQTGAYHYWRLSLKAEVPGIDLDRSFNLPVYATAASSRRSHHDISARAAAAREHESENARRAIGSGNFDIEGLSRALRFRKEGNRILLSFPMFRNRLLTMIAAIFAACFGFASYSMATMTSAGGLIGISITVFAIPFFLVGLLAAVAALYLPFNNLRVCIDSGEVSVLRRLLVIPIYWRKLRRGDISQLHIKRSGSTGQGADKIEHFKICARDNQGRDITLAEDIDGEDIASHFRDYLAQRIGVAAR